MAELRLPSLTRPLLSRGATPELFVPRQRAYTEGGCSTSAVSGPLSFKATRPRKTKEIAARERADSVQVESRRKEPADEVDPRLADDKVSNQILAKIASLVYEHLEEGAGFLEERPSDDEFHEENFLRRGCRCCPWRRQPERPTAETVFRLLADVSRALYFCHQVVVISAVYIERLLSRSTVVLTAGNWRSIVVVALQTASKVCEDVHPWNADFEDCLLDVAGLRYKAGALYRLESIFLEQLQWRVFVDGEEYGRFYFSLLEDRMQDLGGDVLSPLGRINPIYEDDALSERSDIERGKPLSRNSSHASLSIISSSGEKEELLASWRRMLKETGDSSALVSRAMLEAWRLEKSNPHIGALRHAPRALAPSRHIPESADLLWAHEMAKQTMQAMSPTKHTMGKASAVSTLSGATGQQLASELQRRLGEYGGHGVLGTK